MRSLIFVYGSLMSGFHNNDLLRGAIFIGEALLCGKFTMHSLGSFPAVIHDEEGSDVRGEIWSVTEDAMRSLDQLEGHPEWYRRDVYAAVSSNGDSRLVWAYIFQKKLTHTEDKNERYSRLVPGNNWAKFRPDLRRHSMTPVPQES